MAYPNAIFRGRVVNGNIRIAPEQLESFKVLKESLNGKQVEVILRKADKRPDHSLHRYYRGIVLPIMARESGHVDLEMHNILKRELIPVDVERPELGVRSTADLTEAEFSEFIDGAKRMAAFLGIIIPDPGEMEPR